MGQICNKIDDCFMSYVVINNPYFSSFGPLHFQRRPLKPLTFLKICFDPCIPLVPMGKTLVIIKSIVIIKWY